MKRWPKNDPNLHTPTKRTTKASERGFPLMDPERAHHGQVRVIVKDGSAVKGAPVMEMPAPPIPDRYCEEDWY